MIGIVTDDLRTKDIGNYQWRMWSKILLKYLAVREEFKNKTEDCVDLHFKALREDPIQAVKEIYSKVGVEGKVDLNLVPRLTLFCSLVGKYQRNSRRA